jgi:hypothetical protein
LGASCASGESLRLATWPVDHHHDRLRVTHAVLRTRRHGDVLASVTYDYRGQRGNDIWPTGLPNVHEAVSQIFSEKLPASAAYWPLDDVSQQHGSPSREDGVFTDALRARRQGRRARSRWARRRRRSAGHPDRGCPTCDASDSLLFSMRTWMRYRCDILLLPPHGDDDSTGSPMEPSTWQQAGTSRSTRVTEGDASRRQARPSVRQRAAMRGLPCCISATWGVAKRGRADLGRLRQMLI